MICRICNNKFYIKRDFIGLFSNKKYIICDSCYKKYPIDLNLETIELEKYNCYILSLFQKKQYINYNAYIYEYSEIINKYYKNDDNFLLIYDALDLTDDNCLEVLDVISKLWQKNLFVITFFIKK